MIAAPLVKDRNGKGGSKSCALTITSPDHTEDGAKKYRYRPSLVLTVHALKLRAIGRHQQNIRCDRHGRTDGQTNMEFTSEYTQADWYVT